MDDHFPIDKTLGAPVVECFGLTKQYKIKGRSEMVAAIKCVDLNEDSEFYSIRRGEFVMALTFISEGGFSYIVDQGTKWGW